MPKKKYQPKNRTTCPIKIYPIFKNYAWGGFGENSFLKKIFNLQDNHHHWAEAWLGTYQKSASYTIINNKKTSIDTFINLTWLLKILDVKNMLSLQIHPNRKQAIEGYKNHFYDDNKAKYEIMLPLTDFWLIAGFLPKNQLIKTLTRYSVIKNFFIAEIKELKKYQKKREINQIIKTIFNKIINLTTAELTPILSPLIKTINEKNKSKSFKKNELEYWFLKAHKKNDYYEPALLSFFIMNLIHIRNRIAKTAKHNDAICYNSGTAILIKPGLIHTYLEGTCLEQITNSDNVVRAGLTTKIINIPEILKIINYQERGFKIIKPLIVKNNSNYFLPKLNFNFTLSKNKKFDFNIIPKSLKNYFILLLKGKLEIHHQNNIIKLKKGDIYLLSPNIDYQIQNLTNTKYILIKE